ncbi:MAG: hypothetical protein CL916_12250 [Deltaproteobacteria bacterium]|nr:hypothetical protein [Deltaproteobacteria bacterium]
MDTHLRKLILKFELIMLCSIVFNSCLSSESVPKRDMTVTDMMCICSDTESNCSCQESDQTVTHHDAGQQDMHSLDMDMLDADTLDMMRSDQSALDAEASCVAIPELCDDLDNDCDGEVDEGSEVTSLYVRFSDDTIIDPEHANIAITDPDGNQIEGSPFSGDELRNETVVVMGRSFIIEYTLSQQARRFSGYRVVEITDQTGRIIDLSYPFVVGDSAEEPHPIPLSDTQSIIATDSDGAGVNCGSNIGVCKEGVLTCFAGQLICSDEIRPEAEICDGLDNDCDGQTDEDLAPRPCSLVDGVCASTFQTCNGTNGWQDCSHSQYGTDYQEIEVTCDCLDNDCDGMIDEGNSGEWLSCGFDEFRQGSNSECTLRESATVASGEYHFGSFTMLDGLTLTVNADSSAGLPSDIPCSTNVSPMTPYQGGGGLYLHADQIHIGADSIIDASAENSSFCESNSNWVGVLGPSGGDIHLFASSIYLNGELRAHGGTGSSWSSRLGGTAGSIQVYTDSLIFGRAGKILSYGGLVTSRGRLGTSQGGPGAGLPNPGGVGADTAGGGNSERSLRVSGLLSFEGDLNTVIESRDGNLACDGLVDLWGGAILAASGVCAGEDIFSESSLMIEVAQTTQDLQGISIEVIDLPTSQQIGSCRLNHYGRCNLYNTLVEGRPYQIKQTLEAEYPYAITSGIVKLQYGDRITGHTSIVELPWTESALQMGIGFQIESEQ